jgi:hypothetical protein
VNPQEILNLIKATASPLKKQLLTAALITGMLEQRGKSAPVVIGGAALSYYSREVYFTADLDLAYADREALDAVLAQLGFAREGRYWVSRELGLAVESPAAALVGEEAPLERVEFEGGLYCRVLGLEDLVVDRLNACVHWKSKVDCEMAELLLGRYDAELDWAYLERRTDRPENDCRALLDEIRGRLRR